MPRLPWTAHIRSLSPQRVQTSPVDARCLKPLLTASGTALGTNPKEVSADAGFCTDKNLAHLARRRINAFVATGRPRHGEPNSGGKRWRRGSRIAAMATKLKRAGRRSRYRLQANRRARLWSDQVCQKLPSIPSTRPRKSQSRVGDDLHRPQPPQTRPRNRVAHASPSPRKRKPSQNRRTCCYKDRLLAHFLRSRGLKRLDHYSIFMENSARYIECCGAGERAGLYFTCRLTRSLVDSPSWWRPSRPTGSHTNGPNY